MKLKNNVFIILTVVFMNACLNAGNTLAALEATFSETENDLEGCIPAWRIQDMNASALYAGPLRAATEFLADSGKALGEEYSLPHFIRVRDVTKEGSSYAADWEEMWDLISRGFIYYSDPSTDEEKRINRAGLIQQEQFKETCDQAYEMQMAYFKAMEKGEAIKAAIALCSDAEERKFNFVTLALGIEVDADAFARSLLLAAGKIYDLRERYKDYPAAIRKYLRTKRSVPGKRNRILFCLGVESCLPDSFATGGLSCVLLYALSTYRDTLNASDVLKEYAVRAYQDKGFVDELFRKTETSKLWKIDPETNAVVKYSGGNFIPKTKGAPIGSDLVEDNFNVFRDTFDGVVLAGVVQALSEEEYKKRYISLQSNKDTQSDFLAKFKSFEKRLRRRKVAKGKRKVKTVHVFPKKGTAEEAVLLRAHGAYEELRRILVDLIVNTGGMVALEKDGKLEEVAKRAEELTAEQEEVYGQERQARLAYLKAKKQARKAEEKRIALAAKQEADAKRAAEETERRRQEIEAIAEAQAREAAEQLEAARQERLRLEAEKAAEEAMAAQREEEVRKEIAERNRRLAIEKREERLATQAEQKELSAEQRPEEDDSSDSDDDTGTAWTLPLPELNRHTQTVAANFFKRDVTQKEIEAFVALHQGVRMEVGKNEIIRVYFVSAEEGEARPAGEKVYFDMGSFHPPHTRKWVARNSVRRLQDKFRNIKSTPEYWGIEEDDTAEANPAAAAAASFDGSSSSSSSSSS